MITPYASKYTDKKGCAFSDKFLTGQIFTVSHIYLYVYMRMLLYAPQNRSKVKQFNFLYDQDQEQMMHNSSLHFTQRKDKNATS